MTKKREWGTAVTCKLSRDEERNLARLAKLLGITRSRLVRGMIVPMVREKLLSLDS